MWPGVVPLYVGHQALHVNVTLEPAEEENTSCDPQQRETSHISINSFERHLRVMKLCTKKIEITGIFSQLLHSQTPLEVGF